MRKISYASLLLVSFTILSCNNNNNESLPKVVTLSAVDVTETSAQADGTVYVNNDLAISEVGFCWNLEGEPTISDTKLALKPSLDLDNTIQFNALVTGLTSKTVYFFRAYATTNLGTAYGEPLTICTCKYIAAELFFNIPSDPWKPWNLKRSKFSTEISLTF
jgi:hypothetical protein